MAPWASSAAKAGATYALGSGQKGLPILLSKDTVTGNESFLDREMKFARRWLYAKGVMTADEDRNPVETELESFFNDSKNTGHPKADLEVGLHDSTAVMASNLAMREERRVYFKEIEDLDKNMTEDQYNAQFAKSEESYRQSLAAGHKVNLPA